MSAQTNIALIQKLYAAFAQGDVTAILEHLADDVDWGIEAQASSDVPWHGTGKGKAHALKFFEALAREATFTRFEPNTFLASDTDVMCLVSWDSTVNRNGRKMTQNDIHHFTIKNGRVIKWRGWEDTAYSKAQLSAPR